MAQNKLEKIANIEEEIRQLKNRQKQLQQQHNAQERKARTHRLCKRGSMWESLMPDTVTLTDEQFKTFLEKTITTEYARKVLNELKTRGTATAAPKTAGAAQSGSANASGNGGNGARVTG